MNVTGCDDGYFSDNIFQETFECNQNKLFLFIFSSLGSFLQIIEISLSIKMWCFLYMHRRQRKKNENSLLFDTRLPIIPVLYFLDGVFNSLFYILVIFNIINFQNGLTMCILSIASFFRAIYHTIQLRTFIKLGLRSIPVTKTFLDQDKDFEYRRDSLVKLVKILTVFLIGSSFSASIVGSILPILKPNDSMILTIIFALYLCWIISIIVFIVQIESNLQTFERIVTTKNLDYDTFKKAKKTQRMFQIGKIIHLTIAIGIHLSITLGVRFWWFIYLGLILDRFGSCYDSFTRLLQVNIAKKRKMKKLRKDIETDEKLFELYKSYENDPKICLENAKNSNNKDNILDENEFPTYEEAYEKGFKWVRWEKNLTDERTCFCLSYNHWTKCQQLQAKSKSRYFSPRKFPSLKSKMRKMELLNPIAENSKETTVKSSAPSRYFVKYLYKEKSTDDSWRSEQDTTNHEPHQSNLVN